MGLASPLVWILLLTNLSRTFLYGGLVAVILPIIYMHDVVNAMWVGLLQRLGEMSENLSVHGAWSAYVELPVISLLL